MGNRLMGSIFAVVALLVFSPLTLAQVAKQPPDLSGVWLIEENVRVPIPLTPWAAAKYEYNRDPEAPNQSRGRIELDPRGAHCFPPSVNFLMSYGDPFQIVYASPRQVLLLYEYDHWVRHIWMDEQHPKDLDLTWMGHSIGKWDGDTLVVDTIAMRDESWFNTAGHVQSSELHIVERFRRVKQDTLEVEFTFEDPKAFSKPWTVKRLYTLHPDWKLLERVYCDDRFRKGIYYNEGGG